MCNLYWLCDDSAWKGKLELNPSVGGERESHPPITHKESFVDSPPLENRVNIYHKNVVRLNLLCV